MFWNTCCFMMLVPATIPHRNQRRILNSEAITSTIFLGEERLMKEVGERSSVVFYYKPIPLPPPNFLRETSRFELSPKIYCDPYSSSLPLPKGLLRYLGSILCSICNIALASSFTLLLCSTLESNCRSLKLVSELGVEGRLWFSSSSAMSPFVSPFKKKIQWLILPLSLLWSFIGEQA